MTARRPRFTAAERRLIERLSTPARVQAWLNALPYNDEPGGPTQRSFRGVVRHRRAHCMEAALFAATVLEHHGYEPLVMSLESADLLDHVLFAYRHPVTRRWGSVARSRDIGLHGRKPRFPSARALARSYMDPYVDETGRIEAFAVAHLDRLMGRYDWRTAEGNVWAVERALCELAHAPLPSSDARHRRLRRAYLEHRAAHGGAKPTRFRGREHWTALPGARRRKHAP